MRLARKRCAVIDDQPLHTTRRPKYSATHRSSGKVVYHENNTILKILNLNDGQEHGGLKLVTFHVDVALGEWFRYVRWSCSKQTLVWLVYMLLELYLLSYWQPVQVVAKCQRHWFIFYFTHNSMYSTCLNCSMRKSISRYRKISRYSSQACCSRMHGWTAMLFWWSIISCVHTGRTCHHLRVLLFRSKELKLLLTEEKKKGKSETNPYMGYILLQCTLVPKTSDEKEQVFMTAYCLCLVRTAIVYRSETETIIIIIIIPDIYTARRMKCQS